MLLKKFILFRLSRLDLWDLQTREEPKKQEIGPHPNEERTRFSLAPRTVTHAFFVCTGALRRGKRVRQMSQTRPSHPRAVQCSLP